MRNIMILAAFIAGLGIVMAQMADKMTATPALASTVLPNATPVETVAQTGVRSITLPRDGRGHFQTEGRIDGQRIGFMIGTCASVVALNETSAARFGLRPSRGDYNATVTTSNGTLQAPRPPLPMLPTAGLRVPHVHSYVL